jgi:hypothetical protein
MLLNLNLNSSYALQLSWQRTAITSCFAASLCRPPYCISSGCDAGCNTISAALLVIVVVVAGIDE